METFRHGKAVIRVHGEPDTESIKEATRSFLKRARRRGNERDVHGDAREAPVRG